MGKGEGMNQKRAVEFYIESAIKDLRTCRECLKAWDLSEAKVWVSEAEVSLKRARTVIDSWNEK